MGAYAIFLGILQVFILSSMLAIYRRYGKKAFLKYGAFLLLLVALVFTSLYIDKTYYIWSKKPISQMNFHEKYEYFVSNDKKEFCKDKSEICKKYMLGSRFLLVRKWELGINYLKEVYENNSSAEELNIEAYRVPNMIAKAYEELEDIKYNNEDYVQSKEQTKEALKYYKISATSGDRAKVCKVGELYYKLGDDKNSLFYAMMGATRGYIECNPTLATYFIQLKEYTKARELLEDAYKLDSYNPLTNYNLGVIESDKAKQKKFMLVAEQRYKEIPNFYSKTGSLFELLQTIDVSNLFLEEIIIDKKFNKTVLEERAEKFFNGALASEIKNKKISIDVDANVIVLKESKVTNYSSIQEDSNIKNIKLLNKLLFVDQLPENIQQNIVMIKKEMDNADIYQNKFKRKYSVESINSNIQFSWSVDYDFKEKSLVYRIELI